MRKEYTTKVGDELRHEGFISNEPDSGPMKDICKVCNKEYEKTYGSEVGRCYECQIADLREDIIKLYKKCQNIHYGYTTFIEYPEGAIIEFSKFIAKILMDSEKEQLAWAYKQDRVFKHKLDF